ncbi:MAG: hypothetical protein KGI13_09225 [Betaproteobacteria bacterium]|nr:hypothetical protein [Betaproteobacteria bacterium]
MININLTNNSVFTSRITQSLDSLKLERDEWEKTDYKKANDGLYNLLGSCKRIYSIDFINGDESQRKELRNNLMARLKADGIKVQKNSPVLTMFVRFVFNSDRKRAHLYSYVLKAAISHDVKHDEMATWISSQGGIEEIRRKSVVSKKTLQKREKLESAKQTVISHIEQANVSPIAELSISGVKEGQYALLLAKPQPNGLVSIVGVLPELEESFYNAILQKMAKRKVESDEADAVVKKEVDMLSDTTTEQLLLAA